MFFSEEILVDSPVERTPGRLVLVTATAIALVARMWSGDLGKPWGGHRPVVWFVVVTLIPPIGLAMFCMAAIRQIRAAGTGRDRVPD